MLVVTRRRGELLRIRDDIEVVVLGIRGNHVRVGVLAPAGVVIVREKLLQSRQEDHKGGNRGASRSG